MAAMAVHCFMLILLACIGSMLCSVEDPLIPAFLKDEWTNLENDEALDYLTKYELCMAKTYRNNDRCNVYRQQIDGHLAGCMIQEGGVGHVNGRCPQVDHLYRHNSTRPWPEGSNLLSIVKTMKEHGSNTLVLLGDSLTGQSFGDVRCNLIRYGVPHTHNAENPVAKLCELSAPEVPTFQILFQPYTAERLSPFAQAVDKFEQLLANSVTDWLPVKGSVVFVINIGLHYNDDVKVLTDDCKRMFEYFLTKAKQGHIIFFRETTAQHFPTQDGAFGHGLLHSNTFVVKDESAHKIETLAQRMFNPSQPVQPAASTPVDATHADAHALVLPEFQKCAPLSGWEAFNKQNWRNTVAAAVLKEVDPAGVIKYVPFFKATAARNEFHLEGGDCTHYCHGPLLWMVLWDRVHQQLVKVMQEKGK